MTAEPPVIECTVGLSSMEGSLGFGFVSMETMFDQLLVKRVLDGMTETPFCMP